MNVEVQKVEFSFGGGPTMVLPPNQFEEFIESMMPEGFERYDRTNPKHKGELANVFDTMDYNWKNPSNFVRNRAISEALVGEPFIQGGMIMSGFITRVRQLCSDTSHEAETRALSIFQELGT